MIGFANQATHNVCKLLLEAQSHKGFFIFKLPPHNDQGKQQDQEKTDPPRRIEVKVSFAFDISLLADRVHWPVLETAFMMTSLCFDISS